jgi:hypothetical protein
MPTPPSQRCGCLRPSGEPWTDPPLREFTISSRDGGTIRAVLADLPGLRWSYWCVPGDDGPRVVVRSITPTDTKPVLLDSFPYPLPSRRLAYYWERATDPTKPFHPFEVLVPRTLPRRPDPRPYGGRDLAFGDPGYVSLFHQWAAPIAEEVHRADALGCGRHAHLAAMFGVSESQAEEYIRLTREAGHDLPFRRPAKASDPVARVPNIQLRTKPNKRKGRNR